MSAFFEDITGASIRRCRVGAGSEKKMGLRSGIYLDRKEVRLDPELVLELELGLEL
jgi:hypothetical protein